MDTMCRLREIRLESAYQKKALARFLWNNGLAMDDDTEHAVGMFDAEDELCACGCYAGSVLKQFAVAEAYRGQNFLSRILAALVQKLYATGRTQLFVYTKPGNTRFFTDNGFWMVAQADKTALLENSPDGPERFAAACITAGEKGMEAGAVVMNANPFTLGHRYLLEQAAARVPLLYVFVVEEDKAHFSFEDRLAMVRAGTADFDNVRVHPSGPYMISAATFPRYFLKEAGLITDAHDTLDAVLFATRIAPLFNVRVRFAGSEPFCPVTRAYNEAMAREFAKQGPGFEVLPRMERGGRCVSASEVRRILAESGAHDPRLQELVPETTLCWLREHRPGWTS